MEDDFFSPKKAAYIVHVHRLSNKQKHIHRLSDEWGTPKEYGNVFHPAIVGCGEEFQHIHDIFLPLQISRKTVSIITINKKTFLWGENVQSTALQCAGAEAGLRRDGTRQQVRRKSKHDEKRPADEISWQQENASTFFEQKKLFGYLTILPAQNILYYSSASLLACRSF